MVKEKLPRTTIKNMRAWHWCGVLISISIYLVFATFHTHLRLNFFRSDTSIILHRKTHIFTIIHFFLPLSLMTLSSNKNVSVQLALETLQYELIVQLKEVESPLFELTNMCKLSLNAIPNSFFLFVLFIVLCFCCGKA